MDNNISSIFRHRELMWEMAKRDLKTLNKGAILGWLWLILNPLIQTAFYVVVVSFVFRVRMSGSAGPLDYALYILSGMIPWQILRKALLEAPGLIRGRIDIVKEVIYPIETLPLSVLIFGSLGSIVSLICYLVLSAVSGGLSWTMLLLPVPLCLLVVFILGLSWIFSIAGVLLKDLREMVAVILDMMVYASPVIITEAFVGERIWKILLWNPLAHVVICFRDVFLGTLHPTSWAVFAGITLVSLLVGSRVMTKAKLVINEYI